MRAHQRPHTPSAAAIAKPYRFIELALAHEREAIVDELRGAELPWRPSQWKWHRGTWFCVLRGGPGGRGPASELTTGAGVDAAILARLPRLRALLDGSFPAPAPLAWLGLSPRGGLIRAHVDNLAHWDEHHRVHVPLVTNPRALLCVDGGCLHLAAGRAWALNNSLVHGALNEGPNRLHLILDLPSTPAVEAWLAAGVRHLGRREPAAERRIAEHPLSDLSPDERADEALMKAMVRQ